MNVFPEIREILSRGAVIVGIGNPMRCDDAAGAHIAETLARSVPATVPVINAEDIIESYAFDIAGMDRSQVLLIDAVEAPHEPGSIILGRFTDLAASRVNFSTHKLSLSLAVEIMERSGKQVHLLGIVPGNIDYGTGMCPSVTKSCEVIIGFLSECLNHYEKEYVYEC